MLDLMPSRRTKCQFVKVGKMPKNVAQDEKDPAHGGMHQPVKKILQQWPLKKRPEPMAHESPWQAAQQRQLRGAKEQKWREQSWSAANAAPCERSAGKKQKRPAAKQATSKSQPVRRKRIPVVMSGYRAGT